jgi:hypothetical protein
MEGVERLLRGLRLTEAERIGVKVGRKGMERLSSGKPQAIRKLFSEKQAYAEAAGNALGPIWCPMRAVDCKDLGDNLFLFTFHQDSGLKKALEAGPWMFEKELLVLEDFDPRKALDEYRFDNVPIWVRVYKMPLGQMNRENGEQIGDRVGEFMEIVGVEDGLAVGNCLRIKV